LPMSIAKPQAVPTGLSIISAVAGSMACWGLFALLGAEHIAVTLGEI
jgi:hypothetical protein